MILLPREQPDANKARKSTSKTNRCDGMKFHQREMPRQTANDNGACEVPPPVLQVYEIRFAFNIEHAKGVCWHCSAKDVLRSELFFYHVQFLLQFFNQYQEHLSVGWSADKLINLSDDL